MLINLKTVPFIIVSVENIVYSWMNPPLRMVCVYSCLILQNTTIALSAQQVVQIHRGLYEGCSLKIDVSGVTL